MTEEEWLTTRSLYDMLIRFRPSWDQRKLWLFGSASVRRQWHLLTDQRTRHCVQTAESRVDGHCSDNELNAAWESFDEAFRDDSLASNGHLDTHRMMRKLIWGDNPYDAFYVACRVAEGFACYATQTQHIDTQCSWDEEMAATWKSHKLQEQHQQPELLRDIFGNPFRPVAVDPKWLTSTVVAIAEGIYQGRAFDRMPILADALEDAGCDHADILPHCRQPGEHVRGCWVVDLLTGRK